jgi:hypothetical protein
MSDIPNEQATVDRKLWKPWLVLVVLAFATVLTHGVVGVYYALSPQSASGQTSLQHCGEKFLFNYPGWDSDEEHDAAAYNRAALEVLRTGVPHTRSGVFFSHAPLYGYFVAACYVVGGVRLLSVAVAQAVLAGLTAWLVGLTAYRIALRTLWIGVLATGLFLINLRFAMNTAAICPTSLLLFWIALTLWAATYLPRPVALVLFVMALLGGTYTQAGFLLIGAIGGLWLLVNGGGCSRWTTIAGATVIFTGVGIKALLPFWTAGPDPLHMTDKGGVAWEANNPYYESMRLTDMWGRRPGNPWSDWRPSEHEQQQYKNYLTRVGNNPARAFWLWIRENPRQYATLCFIRLRTTLGPFTGQMSPRNRSISTFYWLLIFPAGYYGWWRMRHLPISKLALLVWLVVSLSDTLVITEWYLRYRIPVDLIFTIYAAVSYATVFTPKDVRKNAAASC